MSRCALLVLVIVAVGNAALRSIPIPDGWLTPVTKRGDSTGPIPIIPLQTIMSKLPANQRLLLVMRHGQGYHNVKNGPPAPGETSHFDALLNEVGKKQASDLGKNILSKWFPDDDHVPVEDIKFITSPMRRPIITALTAFQHVFKNDHVQWVADDGCHEATYHPYPADYRHPIDTSNQELYGKRRLSLREMYGSDVTFPIVAEDSLELGSTSDMDMLIKGKRTESDANVHRRAHGVMKKIDALPNRLIVISGHHNINKALFAVLNAPVIGMKNAELIPIIVEEYERAAVPADWFKSTENDKFLVPLKSLSCIMSELPATQRLVLFINHGFSYHQAGGSWRPEGEISHFGSTLMREGKEQVDQLRRHAISKWFHNDSHVPASDIAFITSPLRRSIETALVAFKGIFGRDQVKWISDDTCREFVEYRSDLRHSVNSENVVIAGRERDSLVKLFPSVNFPMIADDSLEMGFTSDLDQFNYPNNFETTTQRDARAQLFIKKLFALPNRLIVISGDRKFNRAVLLALGHVYVMGNGDMVPIVIQEPIM